jgi:hypothetical protein
VSEQEKKDISTPATEGAVVEATTPQEPEATPQETTPASPQTPQTSSEALAAITGAIVSIQANPEAHLAESEAIAASAEGDEESAVPRVDSEEEINALRSRVPKLKELIHSSDAPSRYLTWLSISFGTIALCCFSLLVMRYLEYRKSLKNPEIEKMEEARLYGGWLAGQNSFKKRMVGNEPVFTQPLGEFRVLWPGREMRADLVAECTSEETCTGLKEIPEKIHDALLPVLQASSPEDVLNPNRKMELRRALTDKLNELQPASKVMQVDFSDLTVEATQEPVATDPPHE